MPPFSTETITEFGLWFRTGSGRKWELIAVADSYTRAVGMVGLGDRRGGDWYVSEGTDDVNANGGR